MNTSIQPKKLATSKMPSVVSKRENISPFLKTKQPKFKESQMRLKQTLRIMEQIRKIIQELDETTTQPFSQTFVIPHTIALNERRWNEFCQNSGRVLYTLKRDMISLDLILSGKSKFCEDKFHRLLASSARSCLNLFQRLQKFPEEIKGGRSGTELLEDLKSIASKFWHLIEKSSVYSSVKQKNEHEVKASDEDIAQSPIAQESLAESLMLSSDLDSSFLENISPENIREKLQDLMIQESNKGNKIRKNHKKSGNHRNKQSSKIKLLEPLKRTKIISDPNVQVESQDMQRKQPFTENLPNGRKVQFVHDSLSLKIRPKGMDHPDSYIKQKNCSKRNIITVKPDIWSSSLAEIDAEDIARRTAKDVINELITEVKEAESEAQQSKENKGIHFNLQMKQSIIDLMNRCDNIISKKQEMGMFLNEFESKYGMDQDDDCLDLSRTINKANVALNKLKEIDFQNYQGDHIHYIDNEDKSSTPYFTPEHNLYTVIKDSLDLIPMEEQLRRQKEKFWMSLVKRGYVKPNQIGHINDIDRKEHLHTQPIKEKNVQAMFNKEIQVGSSLSESSASSYVSLSKSGLSESFKNIDIVSEDDSSLESVISEDFPSYDGEG